MTKSEYLKMVFGFLLFTVIAGLIIAIALGDVQEKTSYGLMPLILILSSAADKFAAWAFKPSSPESLPGKPGDTKESRVQ